MEEKSFLEKLQSAPERVKTRWLILGTAAAMVVVVAVWLAYFNNLVSGFAAAPAAGQAVSAPSAPAADDGAPTLWQATANDLGLISNLFRSGIDNLSKILQSPREYIIKPPTK